MYRTLLEIISELICVIYSLRDGEKEWDDYDAILERANDTTEDIEQKLWWQQLAPAEPANA